MLRFILLPTGLVLVGLVLVDLLWTTLSAAGGAGPVTARTSTLAWRLVKGRPRKAEGRRASGVTVVLAVLVSWIALLWAGWALAFSASDQAVVASTDGQAASVVARAYFVGYTVFTLGNGDFKPGGPVWQIATVAATGTGLVLITLAITYLVPVTGAATTRRSLAGYIASLGPTPERIVARAWNGRGFDGLVGHLETLAVQVHEAGQRHLTYPVLHFFGSSDRRTAAPIAIAVLHETLTLLRWGVAADARPQEIALEPARAAVGSFLDTLAGAFIKPAPEPLPPPDLSRLRASGIPTVDDGDFRAALDGDRRTRCLVAGLISGAGWSPPASFLTPGSGPADS